MAIRKKTNWPKVLIIIAIVGGVLFVVGKKYYMKQNPQKTVK